MIVDLVSSVQREDWEKSKQIIFQHWLTECPKLYTVNHSKPWESPGEDQIAAINAGLFTPLVAALCMDSSTTSHDLTDLSEQAGLREISRAGQICGHVFKSGELTYTCSVCATDPTCVMCHECFHKSEHKNHKYKIHSSNGSGYCDCGDPDAWKAGYACPDHIPKEDSEGTVPAEIPEPMRKRLRALLSAVLQYCAGMVCDEELTHIPAFLTASLPEKAEPCSQTQYLTVLYNDETHTFDSVIRALEMYVNCTTQEAMLIATIVDREGRSLVKHGSKIDCESVKRDMQRKTQRDVNRRTEKTGPLEMKVIDSDLVAHQSHAIALLSWLNQQLEIFPLLSELVGDILLTEPAPPLEPTSNDDMEIDRDNDTLLVRLMRWDKRLWKVVRQNVHQLLMKTVLMKYEQKLALAKIYFKYYDEIYRDFIDDDHDLEMSIVSLAVQFLTVPSIARRLIAEDNIIELVWDAIINHTKAYYKLGPDGVPKKPLIFDFSTRTFPAVLKRGLHMVRDLTYVLNIPPTEDQWSDDLRENFVKGSAKLLFFLSCMQGMDEVKRQSMEHQVWEMEWESAFNIQIRIQEMLTLTQLWTYSDKTVHRRLMTMALEQLKMFPPAFETNNGGTHQFVELDGDRHVCPIFDVLTGVVSIHQPIWRFTAGLFAAGNGLLDFMRNETFDSETERFICNEVTSFGQSIYEHPLRVMVLCAQVSAQLWRRNGFSLVNQIHNYYSPICRVEMYDRDLLMMQVAAVLRKPGDLMAHIVTRFRLQNWAELKTDGSSNNALGKTDPDESSKINVILAEEMLHLIINMCAERYQPGVGRSSTSLAFRRELIHLLCMGPHPFSHMSDLMRKMANDPSFEKISLHDIVNEIAEFKKPASTAAGQFHLKDEYLKEYTPFFYHYSKSNVSAAELYQQKIRSKMDRAVMACPPPISIDFEPFFEPVTRLLNCSLTIKICRLIFERTLKRNRYSSDRLLHRALYLVGMGLQEQEKKMGSFDYLTPAAEEDLLKKMEVLFASSEVGTHSDLLWWTIQKYKEIERIATTGSSTIPASDICVKEESPAVAKAKRAEMAAKMRAQALQKMRTMQNRFMNQMESESPATEKTEKGESTKKAARYQDDEEVAMLENDNSFPVCLGLGKSKIGTVLPRKLTCMLCQEEEVLQPGQGKPFVCAAYVQKSMLFAKKPDSESLVRSLRHDFVSAALPNGLDASTCSHVMHYECYQGLAENILSRDRARPRQQAAFQKMIDPELGEYLCPLCKRLSNTAMPVLPALQLMNIDGFSSARSAVNEDFNSWVDRIKQLLEMPPAPAAQKPKAHSRKRSHSERSLAELAKQGDDLSQMPLDNNLSTSVPSASTMQLLMGSAGTASRSLSTTAACDSAMETDMHSPELLHHLNDILVNAETSSSPQQNKAASTSKDNLAKNISLIPQSIIHVLKAFLKMTKQMISPSFEKYGDAMRVFSKFLIKTNGQSAGNFEDNMRGYLSAMMTWQSTVHVLRSISSILKVENKPLFGALNTRQRDCVTSLTRLSAALSYFMQHMPQHTQLMLRALLLPPPAHTICPTSPKSPQCGANTSSSSDNGPASPSLNAQDPAYSTKLPTALYFLSTQTKLSAKGASVNILHVDMLHLAFSLAMVIGWTWQDGKQSLKPKKERELLPDGSLDELHCIRLCLCGHLFQVIATFEDAEMAEEEPIGDAFDGHMAELWSTARPNDEPLVDKRRLRQVLRDAIVSFLRPLALFFQNLTMIPPPEALRDPSLDEFEPLCRYMGLPSTISELLEGTAIQKLFEMWSTALPTDPWSRMGLVKQPVVVNQLIQLPDDFSDLIQMATSFRCPTVPFDEPATNVPTLCLICGTILCSQSYCCQRTVGKETMGACRYHMLHCSGPVGIFLRIRDCLVIMMTSRQRGCIRAAPYVDEFGESDQGFRRGNPLHLNHALYHKLRQLWMTQGIAEEIVNQYEIDHRNIQFDFIHI